MSCKQLHLRHLQVDMPTLHLVLLWSTPLCPTCVQDAAPAGCGCVGRAAAPAARSRLQPAAAVPAPGCPHERPQGAGTATAQGGRLVLGAAAGMCVCCVRQINGCCMGSEAVLSQGSGHVLIRSCSLTGVRVSSNQRCAALTVSVGSAHASETVAVGCCWCCAGL